jgi:hypothetical protein
MCEAVEHALSFGSVQSLSAAHPTQAPVAVSQA